MGEERCVVASAVWAGDVGLEEFREKEEEEEEIGTFDEEDVAEECEVVLEGGVYPDPTEVCVDCVGEENSSVSSGGLVL